MVLRFSRLLFILKIKIADAGGKRLGSSLNYNEQSELPS